MDASFEALSVARGALSEFNNCEFMHASVGGLPIRDGSMDFGYSLGVLHHVPDAASAIKECTHKLKSGAPFLLYIYYAFDNRPRWFRLVWRLSDAFRRIISSLPMGPRYYASQLISLCVYFPLARFALLLERFGLNVDAMPLSYYRRASFYTMRTDALDRFGTRLEKRFTADQIETMMRDAGLERIAFSSSMPYWCAVGIKK
jgi:ubiquinone/menaquinone biosynthesis C-methylase UbiE